MARRILKGSFYISLFSILTACTSETEDCCGVGVNNISTNLAIEKFNNEFFDNDVYSDPEKYLNKNVFDIQRVGNCDDLRVILSEKEKDLKPIYIKLEREFNREPNCSTDEEPFKLTRESNIYIDGSEYIENKIKHILIQQDPNKHNGELPIIIISNNHNVYIKGFKLVGGRNGIDVIKGKVFLGDVVFQNPKKSAISILDYSSSASKGVSDSFNFISSARANTSSCSGNLNEGHTNEVPINGPIQANTDACIVTINNTVTIDSSSTSNGLEIQHKQARVIIVTGAQLTIKNTNVGVDLSGTLEFQGNAKLVIESYVDTGINLRNGVLQCDKMNPTERIITQQKGHTEPPLKFFPTADINSCLRNIGDFDGNGSNDFIWRNSDGHNWIYTKTGGFYNANYLNHAHKGWKIEAIGNFGDFEDHLRPCSKCDDILWRNHDDYSRPLFVYLMKNESLYEQRVTYVEQRVTYTGTGYKVPKEWNLEGTGDFNGDGHDDLFWRKKSGGEIGTNWIDLMTNSSVSSSKKVNNTASSDWKMIGVGNFDNNSRADVLWEHETNGKWYMYKMNGHDAEKDHFIDYPFANDQTSSQVFRFVGIDNKVNLTADINSFTHLLSYDVDDTERCKYKLSSSGTKFVKDGDCTDLSDSTYKTNTFHE